MSIAEPYLTYAKLAIGGIILAVVAGASFHFGTLDYKTKLEGFQAAQAGNTAKAVLAERASGAAELARVNSLLKGYQDAPIDPVSVGLAHRLYVYASGAAGCPVSGAGANPAGAVGSPAVPRGDPELERLSQAAFDAADHDAKELMTIQQAWPR